MITRNDNFLAQKDRRSDKAAELLLRHETQMSFALWVKDGVGQGRLDEIAGKFVDSSPYPRLDSGKV